MRLETPAEVCGQIRGFRTGRHEAAMYTDPWLALYRYGADSPNAEIVRAFLFEPKPIHFTIYRIVPGEDDH